MSEIDDKLYGLLEELDIGPEIDKKKSVPISSPIKAPISIEPLQKPILQLQPPVLETPNKVGNGPDVDLFDSEEISTEISDLQEFIEKHNRDYEEVKTNLRADRARADEIAIMLLGRLESGVASNQETESLIQVVKCLIDSNGHMVKLLDSKSKLLSASKGTIGAVIQQNFGKDNNSDADLESILNQQLNKDDA